MGEHDVTGKTASKRGLEVTKSLMASLTLVTFGIKNKD
jgi:hypothetical protein